MKQWVGDALGRAQLGQCPLISRSAPEECSRNTGSPITKQTSVTGSSREVPAHWELGWESKKATAVQIQCGWKKRKAVGKTLLRTVHPWIHVPRLTQVPVKGIGCSGSPTGSDHFLAKLSVGPALKRCGLDERCQRQISFGH